MDKEDFLNNIDVEGKVVDIIEDLRKESLPLLIWGCGQMSDDVCRYLLSHNITVDGFFLDDEYFDVAIKNSVYGIKIYSKTEAMDLFGKVNVVIGHSKYELGKQLKESTSNISRIFCFSSIHYNQYENVKIDDVKEVADRYVDLCNRLEDKKSIDNLFAFLNTKITGDMKYIFSVYENPITFFKNDVFMVSDKEVYLDIGACDGDTIRLFLDDCCSKYKKIIALEPDNENFLELQQYIVKNNVSDVVLSCEGAWNENKELVFASGGGQISSVVVDDNNHTYSSDTVTIRVSRVDDHFLNEDISIIKINYLDGVLEALEGCEKIIRKNHPKIVATVGFDIYNILKITEYIASLNLDYKLFLRYNSAMTSRFVLYAI